MKVRFVGTLVRSAIGFALSAFADEAPIAASSTQAAIPVESDGSTGHQAIKDHHAKRSKKQHPKTPAEASPKSAPRASSVSDEKRDPPTSDSSGDMVAALSPVEPRLTFQYWNYYAPPLNEKSGDADNGLGRILIPFQVDGIQQILNIFPPVVTDPNAISGPRTGFGDLQIFNFTLTKFDLPQSQTLTVGVGPLLAVPTASSTNFGPDSVQGGAAGVIEARLNWGVAGVLATYQHTLSGAGSELITVQPLLEYILGHGWYFRSSAIMQFNTYSHTNVVPVGLGFGKVFQLSGSYLLTAYVEAQPSIFRSGPARPTSRSSLASNYSSPRA
jgi:hypothetical protein